MYAYAITGVVHPERADVNITDVTAQIGDIGEFKYSVLKSRIAGHLSTKQPISNYRNAALIAERAVRGIADTLGFTNGCGYDVEIIQLLDLQNNSHQVFGVEEKIVSSMKVSERLGAETVAELMKTKFGIYLERSFADLRESIRNPLDSGFYCYRAIECLMHYFKNIDNTSKKQAWVNFRAQLNIEESILRDIQSASNPVRHGNVGEKSELSREALLTKTWQVVEKFVSYALLKSDIK